MHPDNPDAPLTHAERREYFLAGLAKSLDRFNMTSVGQPGGQTDLALAEYRELKAQALSTRSHKMLPHEDSAIWLNADRHGRYLVFPFEDGRSIHLCCAFCPEQGKYTLKNRPPVVETFRLKVTVSNNGFSYWDSRPRGNKFSRMKDDRAEFLANLTRLFFAGNVLKAKGYLSAIEYRLNLL